MFFPMSRAMPKYKDDGGGLEWLYVDMNSFFASVEQQDNPGFRHRPLIVTPVMSDHTSAIAASREAKALGIRTGTRVRDARAMCRELVVIEARPDRYVEVHKRILCEIDTVIPIDKICSIDEVACRLTGSQRAESAARLLGLRVQQRILDALGECMTASVGIAPSQMLAKTAADIVKPLGLTVLRLDKLPGPLLNLNLGDLPGVGPAMTVRLGAAGIADMAALFGLSATRLRELWGGIVGDNFWYALHGIDPPAINMLKGSISHSHVLAAPLRHAEAARGVARRLTAKCGSRLRRMGYRCGALHLSIAAQTGGRAEAGTTFMHTADTFRMLKSVDGLWQSCIGTLLTDRIKKVSVTCSHIAAADGPPDLLGWVPGADDDPRRMRLLDALDGLNQRFGKDTVTIGPRSRVHGFVGAKIAFNRIPEEAEFRE